MEGASASKSAKMTLYPVGSQSVLFMTTERMPVDRGRFATITRKWCGVLPPRSVVPRVFARIRVRFGSATIEPLRYKEQLLAREYFACSTEERMAKYENLTLARPGSGATLKGQKATLSGKGSLFLAEYRRKRFDRVFALFTGISVGIIVEISSTLFRSFIAP